MPDIEPRLSKQSEARLARTYHASTRIRVTLR